MGDRSQAEHISWRRLYGVMGMCATLTVPYREGDCGCLATEGAHHAAEGAGGAHAGARAGGSEGVACWIAFKTVWRTASATRVPRRL